MRLLIDYIIGSHIIPKAVELMPLIHQIRTVRILDAPALSILPPLRCSPSCLGLGGCRLFIATNMEQISI